MERRRPVGPWGAWDPPGVCMTKAPSHRLPRLLAVTLVVVGLAGGARAALLQWDGTLSLEWAVEPLDVFFGPPTGGGVSTLNGSGGAGHLTTLGLAGGITGGGATVPTTFHGPFTHLEWDATLGSGDLAPISGGGTPLTQNELSLRGELRLCLLFMECVAYIPIPLTAGGTRGVGIGGLITVNGFGAAGVKASLAGAPWTIGTAVASTGTTTNGGPTGSFARSGFAHGPASGTTSTARRGGAVQLVTPLQIATSFSGLERVGFIARLTLVFVPEPATALLLGGGVAVLALHGRRRPQSGFGTRKKIA
jgi:hypothetical protein